MKKTLRILMVAIFCMGLILVAGIMSKEAAASSEKEPIKIGINWEFTGPIAETATTGMHGLEYYLDEIGREVNGRKINVIKEDNGTDPAKAMDKAKKLVEVDKVHVMIGPIFTPSAMGVTDYLQMSRTPNMHMIQPVDLMKFGAGKNIWIVGGIHEYAGKQLAYYLYHETGARTASGVYVDFATGDHVAGNTLEDFKAEGGEIVQVQKIAPGTVDFSPYLINMKPANVVVFWMFGPSVPAFLSQFHQYGLKAKIAIPFCGVAFERHLAEIGDKSIGILGSDVYSPLIKTEANRKFVDGFVKKYGYVPADAWSGYVMGKMFVEAFKAAGSDPSLDAINKAFLKIKVDTPMGMFSFLPNGTPVTDMKVLKVIKVKEGRWAWDIEKIYGQVPIGPRP